MPHRDRRRPSERELVALADGVLTGRRRARVEAMVAESPELRAHVERQRRAGGAIRAVAVAAPAGLRTRILGAAQPPAATRRWLLAPALAGASAVAVLLVVVLATTGSPAPSIAQAAGLALRPATEAAPAGHAGAVLPRVRAAGLPYPYWEDSFGWRATGVRRDALSGRPSTTVFYAQGGRRIAYTIVSGPLLALPRNASVTVRDGTRIALVPLHGRTVAIWPRRGHTCVLSGARVPGRALVSLAAWRGGGTIPY